MVTEERTYIIEPGSTDPDLIRTMSPLGEAVEEMRPRTRARRLRRRDAGSTAATGRTRGETTRPPARPIGWLLLAYVAGPFALILDPATRRSRPRWITLGVAGMVGAAAIALWLQDPARLGGGDRAFLVQGVAVAAAAMVWLATGGVGLVTAARRCGDGPLARRPSRRPLLAGLVGLLAPGLGLLLAGRWIRSAATIVVVGLGATAALVLTRAPGWWHAHRGDGQPALMDDLALERILLGLAAMVALGAIGWFVSALEAGRLAAGPRTVRAVSSADRVPAALLLAIVALAVFFRPADLARGLDRTTGTLAAHELRLSSLATARAAAWLAPADPLLELRVAERLDALGRADAAATIRHRLRDRWQRFAGVAVDKDPMQPVQGPGATPPSVLQLPVRPPSPLRPTLDQTAKAPVAP